MSKVKLQQRPAQKNFLLFIIIVIMIWVFAGFLYDDVYHMAEQHSLFVWDSQVMKFLLDQPLGWLFAIGRFCLLSFYYPLLGALLLSLCYAVGIRFLIPLFPSRWEWIAAVPALEILFYQVSQGLNLYYQSEPGIIFVAPILLLLVSILSWLIARKWKCKEKKPVSWLSQGIILLLFALLYGYTWIYKENERLTAALQRQLQEENWVEMIRTAHQAKQPTRAIAAYHAIALVQTDQLLDHWLDIPYQYPDPQLRNRGGLPDDGTDLYLADGNLYAGLIYPAYHQAMERMVIDGPTCYTLKQLMICALLNEEYALANKYLYILMHIPFEQKFVQKYSQLVGRPERILANSNLQKILERTPMTNSFEQEYRSPLFLGYNVRTTQLRGKSAHDASLTACLYTKMLPEVFNRTRPYAGKRLPALVEQAVLLYALERPEVLKYFQINPATQKRFQEFMRKRKSIKPGEEEQLRKEYADFYPYYYYYQNQVDEKEMKKYQILMKGGVN